MNTPLFISNSILIKATPSRVWEVLILPEETQKYMFGCRTVSDWQPGSALLWEATWEGRDMVFVKGIIQEIIPQQKLVYSVFDPNNQTMEDIPENYLWVTYELSQAEGGTWLRVQQGDYSKVADGARRYQESNAGGEGWNPILIQIKAQAEAS
ncbi:MAG: SRPBCC domain-containing protein [Bacteroidetes bacterium]|nr:SRPBCC domain-containing protein [Bacteroidota bacterium]